MYMGNRRKIPRSSFMVGPMGDAAAVTAAIDQPGLITPTVVTPVAIVATPPLPAPVPAPSSSTSWLWYGAAAVAAYWLFFRKEPIE